MADVRSYLLRSVTNAARVLRAFTYEAPSLGVSEIAQRLDIAKSTAHRLLATLAEEGLLGRDPVSGKYRLGLGLYELGQRAVSSLEITEIALPVLERLRDRTGETSHVAILDGRDVIYVARRASPRSLRLFNAVGHRNWAHCTSTGKLLLAFQEPETLNDLLPEQLEAVTPYTITDRRLLLKQLDEIRTLGVSENVSEAEAGVASAAAPIRDHDGVVMAAIGAAGPVSRIEESSPQHLVEAVVAAGREASRLMGWRGDAASTEDAAMGGH